MSWYREYGDWEPRVSTATKIAHGHAAAKALAKKENREPCPIKIEGRKIAKTFWGEKWCENLERYSQISNRLPRGATYVRNGSVADLVIESGQVRAIVGGTDAYQVKISIQTLTPKAWKEISRDCAQEIDSLLDLLQGRFSEGVMQRLTRAEGGLFPRKNEISMSCTCPDSTTVCKHVAATFYGVAARLDLQPELLFKLRNVDHHELIGHATSAANLDQAFASSTTTPLSDSDLGSIFGIDLESTEITAAPATLEKAPPKSRAKKTKATVTSTSKVLPARPAASRRKQPESIVPVPKKQPTRSTVKSVSKAVTAMKLTRTSKKKVVLVKTAKSAEPVAKPPSKRLGTSTKKKTVATKPKSVITSETVKSPGKRKRPATASATAGK